MSSTVLHIRAETKPLEHRSAVTPTTAKKLVDAGYTVNVERSPLSIFQDKEYEGTGATLVPTGSWTDTPSEHIIIGLKELPEEDFPLNHTVRKLLQFLLVLVGSMIELTADVYGSDSMSNLPTVTRDKADGNRFLAASPGAEVPCSIWSSWKTVGTRCLKSEIALTTSRKWQTSSRLRLSCRICWSSACIDGMVVAADSHRRRWHARR